MDDDVALTPIELMEGLNANHAMGSELVRTTRSPATDQKTERKTPLGSKIKAKATPEVP